MDETRIHNAVSADQYAIKTIVQSAMCEHNLMDLFDGTMSIDDFVSFVYFEYQASQFIQSEKPRAINWHVTRFKTKADMECEKKDDDTPETVRFSYAWLTNYEERAITRTLYRYIEKMLQNRNLPKCNKPETQCFTALRDIQSYSGAEFERRFEGVPMPETFFYQLICESFLKVSGLGIYERLAQARTSTDRIKKFYQDFDRLIENFMYMDYEECDSDEQRKTYIAKAINLVKLGDRRKLNLIYDFAVVLNDLNPTYFENHGQEYIYGNGVIPPIFYDDNPNGHVYPAPYMVFDKYATMFATADIETCRVEANRYYAIKLLGAIIMNHLMTNNLEIPYSDEKFCWFIHTQYDVFGIYQQKIEYRRDRVLTLSVAKKIHSVAEYMLKQSNYDP